MDKFLILSILALVSGALGATPYFTELESLSSSQREALDKLKLSASSFVPHEYMKEDIYLVKFLQVAGYNARRAEDVLRETIKWREETQVDKWGEPGFFDEFTKKGEFPSYNDGWDREGRPIAEAFYGDWNIRAVALKGKIKHLLNYALRNVEQATFRIRQAQAEGKNITRFIVLLNMDGFSVVNQGCPLCLPLYLGFASQYEKHWPNMGYRAILINTPSSFEGILNAMRPLMSPQTRAAIRVFGANKNEWKPYLDKLIDPTEISDWYDPSGKERKSQ